ncbi:MAG: LamG domain-containing protein, partial [Treponema sp.]|nr:LamG domain-containing protein [Treponema sp.]
MKHGFFVSAAVIAGAFLLIFFPACPLSEGEEECIITLDSGTSAVPNSTIAVTTGYVLEALPVPSGGSSALFRGWFDKETAGEPIEAPYTVRGSATLYAYWYDANGEPYDLVFDAGEGNTVDENGERTLTRKMRTGTSTLKDIPFPSSSSGNAFTGWVYNTTNTEFTRLTPAANIVVADGRRPLNARWATGPTSFTITFDAVGGAFDGEREKAVTITAPGQVTVGENWPADPARDGFAFLRYDDALDSTAIEFTRDTKIWKTLRTYAVWKLVNPDLALILHHDFADVSGTVITSKAVPSGGTYTAEMKGSDGAAGSKEIGGKIFYYYKTGPKLAMSNANVSYLDLGADAGTVLKSAANGYTVAAYIRTDGDRGGNGSFAWTFSTTNSMGSSGAVYFIANTGRNDHNITLSGAGGEQRVRNTGVITNGTWLHVAYTQNGKAGPDNGRLYVNGEEVVKGTITILPSDISG